MQTFDGKKMELVQAAGANKRELADALCAFIADRVMAEDSFVPVEEGFFLGLGVVFGAETAFVSPAVKGI